jgi:hypothetical protein
MEKRHVTEYIPEISKYHGMQIFGSSRIKSRILKRIPSLRISQ